MGKKERIKNMKEAMVLSLNNFDTEEVMLLLADFIEKHPMAVDCGSEYIMQDDEAQVDALQLVCEIFDNM